MQEQMKLINLYHTGFLACLCLTVLFFLLTVFLFFKFDIRGIFEFRTGRGARKRIQKMEEINAMTGKLRDPGMFTTDSLSRKVMREDGDVITYPVTAQTNTDEVLGDTELLCTDNLTAETVQSAPSEPENLPGTFKIKKSILLIHTNEVI